MCPLGGIRSAAHLTRFIIIPEMAAGLWVANIGETLVVDASWSS